MNAMTQEPQLAAPGAGLPKVELFIARLLFGRTRKKTRETLNRLFDEERAKIRALAESLGERASERVLIARLPGLEDSSRYWSVWMVLDHLRIVNSQIAGVIRLLREGKRPDRPASTAAVKPDPGVDADVVAAFEEACTAFTTVVDETPNLRTNLSFPHPWFGPLNAAEWHAMGAMHMRIHRKQIEAILAQLQ